MMFCRIPECDNLVATQGAGESRGRNLQQIKNTIFKCEKVKPSSQGWLVAEGMLLHRRSLPHNFVRFPEQIAGTHLYTWVERGTVRVKCFAQEHNTLSPARTRTRTARSGVQRTNHEATAPPHINTIFHIT